MDSNANMAEEFLAPDWGGENTSSAPENNSEPVNGNDIVSVISVEEAPQELVYASEEPERVLPSLKAEPGPSSEKVSPSLPSGWISGLKGKREIPKAVKIGGGIMLALIVLVFVAPKASRSAGGAKSMSMLSLPNVEDADHLKKRRKYNDDSFGRREVVQAPKMAAAPGFDLAARKLQREDNPEDIRSLRKPRPRLKGRSSNRQVRSGNLAPKKSKSPFKFNPAFSGGDSHVETSPGAVGKKRVLLPSAAEVEITLNKDVVIRSGRTTVIARVVQNQALPFGTQLIGYANTRGEGVISIKFKSIVLPGGQTVKARGEAIDADTDSPDLLAGVTGGAELRQQRGVARDVGVSVADGLASSVLGSGIVGDAARRTISGADRRRPIRQRTPKVVTLSKNNNFKALFLQEVIAETR